MPHPSRHPQRCARYPSPCRPALGLHFLVAGQLPSALLDRALRLLGHSFNVFAIHCALLWCGDRSPLVWGMKGNAWDISSFPSGDMYVRWWRGWLGMGSLYTGIRLGSAGGQACAGRGLWAGSYMAVLRWRAAGKGRAAVRTWDRHCWGRNNRTFGGLWLWRRYRPRATVASRPAGRMPRGL